jgi:hypothetical protein
MNVKTDTPDRPISQERLDVQEVKFWSDNGDSRVAFRTYGSVAVEPNIFGDVIIRREPDWYEKDQVVTVIPLGCADAFLRAFHRAVEEGREIAAEIEANRPERDAEPELRPEPDTGAHESTEPEPPKPQNTTSREVKDPTAADRMRRYRERKRNAPVDDRNGDHPDRNAGTGDRNAAPLQPELLSS